MTIFSTQANPQPMAFTELSVKLLDQGSFELPVVDPVIEGICLCDFGCDHLEEVMGTTRTEDDPLYFYETDQNDFLVSVPDTVTGTLEIYLVNIKTGVETLIFGDTYGTPFSLGFNSEQPDKGGYRFNWSKILNTLGPAEYKVKIITENFGKGPVEELSRTFKLTAYDPEYFRGTVKIETFSDGVIENGTDYTGLNWNGSIRIQGRFYELADEKQEEEFFPDFEWNQEQIQERQLPKYGLEIYEIDSKTWKYLLRDRLLSNIVRITDYNYGSFSDLRNIEVVKPRISTFEPVPDSRNAYAVLEFEAKDNGNLKRNGG